MEAASVRERATARLIRAASLGLGLSLFCGALAAAAGPPDGGTAGAGTKVERASGTSGDAAKPDRPQQLPALARSLLHARMRRHARDVGELMDAAVRLRYEAAATRAEQIAAESRLARPVPGQEDTINARLPARFYDLQDELRERARDLAAAARARDDARLRTAFGRMSEICITCHSLYRPGETRDRRPAPQR